MKKRSFLLVYRSEGKKPLISRIEGDSLYDALESFVKEEPRARSQMPDLVLAFEVAPDHRSVSTLERIVRNAVSLAIGAESITVDDDKYSLTQEKRKNGLKVRIIIIKNEKGYSAWQNFPEYMPITSWPGEEVFSITEDLGSMDEFEGLLEKVRQEARRRDIPYVIDLD